MRVSRPTAAFLERFSDVLPNELRELSDVLVPVVVLGEDRVDNERSLFFDGGEITSAGGNTPRVELHAVSGDLEILDWWVARPTGNSAWGWFTGAANPAATFPTTQSLNPAASPTSNGGLVFTSGAPLLAAGFVYGQAGLSQRVPIRGVLQQGLALRVEQLTPTSTLSCFVQWRNAS